VSARPVTGATTVAGVIGWPIRHSRSPAILNAAFAAAGLDWVYAAFAVPPGGGGDAVRAVRTLGLGGLSVTMPHKEDAAAAVDDLSDAAAALGAVNCVSVVDGRLVGDNTDGPGFVDAIRAELGVDLAGRRVVVLGAGGAARAIVRAAAVAGAASVQVVNRTEAKAEAAAALAGACGSVADAHAAADADVVVNATPVGMAGSSSKLLVQPDWLHADQVVVDIVYHPARTPLLEAAAARGARTANGLGMLVHQAAHAFRAWTGEAAPIGAMAAAADPDPRREKTANGD
jgi:shikimate dehydrogenase